ncbi:MSMEG_0565 family glycosyltransferase [Ideonella azotifigens]|uniref:MSMEG_0565 family glycosyltransferase n=1 Tax=Ideonella azotifigens TaxID=513160 RepID=A0ABN1K2D6_9BURK|nr:MSMEG_0565 family glycosyltransferase [Ideonella azotifigens]MCD2343822.1 MSMEG_0565 family glycosyltransferase [Ideonella azotifigens]
MTNSLRIALLTHSVLPRGGVVHTLELAEALHARGHAVTVLAPAEPGQRLFRRTSCEVALLPLPEVTGDLVQQVGQRIAGLERGLPALLRGRFDLLHAQDSLSGNALATLRRRCADLPAWVRTVHHLDSFAQPQLADWQRRAWQAADAVACVSDTWCECLLREHGLRAARMFNGVNLDRFRPGPVARDAAQLAALGLLDDTPICLAVGGVEQRKNSVRLLQAFGALRANDPAWADARLVIAGGASLLDHSSALRGWQAALAALGLGEGPGEPVQRLGAVADAALPALMRRARLLAMPSLVEGFGLVALEALACGTPVLVSRRAPFTEHLAGAPAVAWCEPEDVGSIARGLQQAALAQRLHQPPPVCLAHSWARSAALHQGWYQRVLQRRVLRTGVSRADQAERDAQSCDIPS